MCPGGVTCLPVDCECATFQPYHGETNRQHNGKKKVQKDKQRSTKYTYKTKDRVT
jgi:hypothetical protein